MKPDYSLGYERNGEHFGLGLSLGTPPESFTVRKHDYETGDYEETFYLPEETCTNISEIDCLFECSKCGCQLRLDIDWIITIHKGTLNYCPNCRAKVVIE